MRHNVKDKCPSKKSIQEVARVLEQEESLNIGLRKIYKHIKNCPLCAIKFSEEMSAVAEKFEELVSEFE